MASLSASNHVARVLSVANHVADVDASSRIANSWRRCLIGHKLDPARQGPPQTLTEAEIRQVAELYANGKAVSIASVFEIDNVIDPAETRRWIMAGLRSVPKPEPRTTKKRPCIDTW